MLRRPNFRSLRGRLFVALFLTAAVPTILLLVGGSVVFREIVAGTGSAGPWTEVAATGQELLDRILMDPGSSPELREAAEQHRAQLSESVRFSRLYAFLGDRVLLLLPVLAGGLFVLAAGLSLWSAKQVSRTLSRPVRDIVRWTEALGQGLPLPAGDPEREAREIREVRDLRNGLRSMEEELRAARSRELREARNRSWSEMARRIAHDLKNPLTPMQMAARNAARSTDPLAAQAGEVLLEEIARLDDLSRAFAQFGRPPEGPPSAVDMGELMVHLVRRMDPHGTLLAYRGPEAAVFMEGHPVALERVVRNLVANALDAQTSAGWTLGTAECPPVEIALEGTPDSIRIAVRDRGAGLPAGAEDRIWEPDFTTKRRGTGLGLPLVRQVVEAHGGDVMAHPRPGGGTSFDLRFPRIPQPETGGADITAHPPPRESAS